MLLNVLLGLDYFYECSKLKSNENPGLMVKLTFEKLESDFFV